MSKFSERLKELRRTKGPSQHQLAKNIGVSKSSVNMYERGEREPGLETVEAIADFYNVDLDYLLGKTNIPNKSLLTSAETIISDADYSLYNKLDKVDKAEIRGTIKQMLKADKYKTTPRKQTYTAQIAAQGHGVENIEVKVDMDEVQKIYDDLD